MKRLIAALLLVSSTALATTDVEKERARHLFDQGNALIDTGKYVEALDKFRSAYALWPNPKILLNIATTLRALGRNAEAADAYELYIASPDADPKRREDARAIRDSLDAGLGKLRVEPKTKMRVLVDGKLVSEGEAKTIRVEPGVHVVVGDADGASPISKSIAVAAGETRPVVLEVPVRPETSATPKSPAVPPPPVAADTTTQPSAPRRVGVFARADVDATFRGGIGAVGASYRFDRLEIGAAALLGGRRGGEALVTVFIFDGVIRPVILGALPVLFADGARIGARGGVGVHFDVGAPTLFVHASAAHFFSAPEGYSATYALLTAGAQLRF